MADMTDDGSPDATYKRGPRVAGIMSKNQTAVRDKYIDFIKKTWNVADVNDAFPPSITPRSLGNTAICILKSIAARVPLERARILFLKEAKSLDGDPVPFAFSHAQNILGALKANDPVIQKSSTPQTKQRKRRASLSTAKGSLGAASAMAEQADPKSASVNSGTPTESRKNKVAKGPNDLVVPGASLNAPFSIATSPKNSVGIVAGGSTDTSQSYKGIGTSAPIPFGPLHKPAAKPKAAAAIPPLNQAATDPQRKRPYQAPTSTHSLAQEGRMAKKAKMNEENIPPAAGSSAKVRMGEVKKTINGPLTDITKKPSKSLKPTASNPANNIGGIEGGNAVTKYITPQKLTKRLGADKQGLVTGVQSKKINKANGASDYSPQPDIRIESSPIALKSGTAVNELHKQVSMINSPSNKLSSMLAGLNTPDQDTRINTQFEGMNVLEKMLFGANSSSESSTIQVEHPNEVVSAQPRPTYRRPRPTNGQPLPTVVDVRPHRAASPTEPVLRVAISADADSDEEPLIELPGSRALAAGTIQSRSFNQGPSLSPARNTPARTSPYGSPSHVSTYARAEHEIADLRGVAPYGGGIIQGGASRTSDQDGRPVDVDRYCRDLLYTITQATDPRRPVPSDDQRAFFAELRSYIDSHLRGLQIDMAYVLAKYNGDT